MQEETDVSIIGGGVCVGCTIGTQISPAGHIASAAFTVFKFTAKIRAITARILETLNDFFINKINIIIINDKRTVIYCNSSFLLFINSY